MEKENHCFSEDNSKRDKFNKWVENTICYVILRKKYDKVDKNKNLLYLFRLLSVLYRIKFPTDGEEKHIDSDLRIIVEYKICNAAAAFFEETHNLIQNKPKNLK